MKNDQIHYGDLVVIGSNGHLPGGDKTRRRGKLPLTRRPVANGIRPGHVERVNDAQKSDAVRSRETHAVSYTLSRHEAVVVEYEVDEDTDMFQIGRSTDSHIDLVVSDTDLLTQRAGNITTPLDGNITNESTISRFACRILVNRKPPHEAKIYAAGFDASKNIFLGEKAIRWRTDGLPDGLTTNGVMIVRPTSPLWPGYVQPEVDGEAEANVENEEAQEVKPMAWREISVGGGVYAMRQKRSIPHKSHRLMEDNVLVDGTLIDLCGVTLLWRTTEGLKQTATLKELVTMVDQLNMTRPQCPVRYRTLLIPRPTVSSSGDDKAADPDDDGPYACHVMPAHNPASSILEDPTERQAYVYLRCGHVHGRHDWKAETDRSERRRTCPLCIQPGIFVPLELGQEPAFYVDREPATHCFSPCGHFASDNTVKYWYSLRLPNRHNYEMHPQCPFCTSIIDGPPIRLIFQDNI